MQGHARHSKSRRTIGMRVVLLASLFLATSCTYFKYAAIQTEYARLQTVEPSQQNLKHMIERDTFAVIGHTLDQHKRYGRDQTTNAIAAFSSQYREHELVDVMHDIGAGTHFGLNLPSGEYDIVVFSDLDKNGFYEGEEVIGRSKLTLSKQRYPSMVVTRHVIELEKTESIDWRQK